MKNKQPWVFWFSISYRPKWFKKFWRTRGTNFIEYQIFFLKISIGRPWLHEEDYGLGINTTREDQIKEINKGNLKQPFSLLIGKYK